MKRGTPIAKPQHNMAKVATHLKYALSLSPQSQMTPSDIKTVSLSFCLNLTVTEIRTILLPLQHQHYYHIRKKKPNTERIVSSVSLYKIKKTKQQEILDPIPFILRRRCYLRKGKSGSGSVPPFISVE